MRYHELKQNNEKPTNIKVVFDEDSTKEERKTILSALRGVADGLGDFDATDELTDDKIETKKHVYFDFEDSSTAEQIVIQTTNHLSGLTFKQVVDNKMNVEK